MTTPSKSAVHQSIKGWASIALGPAIQIVHEFEAQTGITVQFELLPSADITVNLGKGLSTDFVFYPTKPIKHFINEGILSSDSFTPVVESGIGITVPMNSKLKAPQNANELKDILLNVNSIIYATGPSGDHIEHILNQLEIKDVVKNKIKIISGLVAKGIEEGMGDIGFQQIPEILLVPGAKLLCPLPNDIQLKTPFSLSIHRSSSRIQECKDLFKYLSDQKYKDLYAKYGLQMFDY